MGKMVTECSKGVAADSHVIAKATLVKALMGRLKKKKINKYQEQHQKFFIPVSYTFVTVEDYLIYE